MKNIARKVRHISLKLFTAGDLAGDDVIAQRIWIRLRPPGIASLSPLLPMRLFASRARPSLPTRYCAIAELARVTLAAAARIQFNLMLFFIVGLSRKILFRCDHTLIVTL